MVEVKHIKSLLATVLVLSTSGKVPYLLTSATFTIHYTMQPAAGTTYCVGTRGTIGKIGAQVIILIRG